jgi:hypothetical protein
MSPELPPALEKNTINIQQTESFFPQFGKIEYSFLQHEY